MLKVNLNETIAAISTSIGEGGIGIVRISGKDSLNIVKKIFVSQDEHDPLEFKTYTMHYGKIVSEGKIIDEVILTLMRAPKSYTKEDVVEINCHGGGVVLNKILELVLAKGARLAEAGEFTRRAFLNGRIDLAQAEAVVDIIRAKTDFALKIGLEQLQGRLSSEIKQIRGQLLDVLTFLEAQIDFSEEDSVLGQKQRIKSDLFIAWEKIRKLLIGSKSARIYKDGLHVVICGKPNVGKSSLLNAILKQERSIVTHIAGTTRDTIEELVDLKGIPVRIVDTAGILKARDLVGRKAVMRSQQQIKLADLVIVLFDGSKRLSKEDRRLMSQLKSKKVLAVINKIDLEQKINKEIIKNIFPHLVELSAKKSRNINLLEEAILNLVHQGAAWSFESVMVSNLRHTSALVHAEKLIAEVSNSLDNGLSVEFIAQGIKDALVYLDNILGKDFSENLLDKIFGQFCIGK